MANSEQLFGNLKEVSMEVKTATDQLIDAIFVATSHAAPYGSKARKETVESVIRTALALTDTDEFNQSIKANNGQVYQTSKYMVWDKVKAFIPASYVGVDPSHKLNFTNMRLNWGIEEKAILTPSEFMDLESEWANWFKMQASFSAFAYDSNSLAEVINNCACVDGEGVIVRSTDNSSRLPVILDLPEGSTKRWFNEDWEDFITEYATMRVSSFRSNSRTSSVHGGVKVQPTEQIEA